MLFKDVKIDTKTRQRTLQKGSRALLFVKIWEEMKFVEYRKKCLGDYTLKATDARSRDF